MNKRIIIVGVVVIAVSALLWVFLGTYGNKINKPAQALPTNEALNIKVIAFGDSLTAGYGISQNEAYPAQLEAVLQAKGYSVTVINSGVSGETTRGALERANFIKNQNPDIVLLGSGGNDALRFLPVSETKKNIRATITILQSGPKPPVIGLLQMQAPLNVGREYKQEFDALYASIAAEKGLTLIPFITAELFLDESNKQADGIHYNAVGYKKVVNQYIVPALEPMLMLLQKK